MQFSLQSFSRLAPICRKRHLASGLGADLQMFPTGQVTENILQLGKLARGGRTAFIQKSGGGCQANSIFSIWFYLTFSSQITHQKRNVRNLLILLLGGRDVKDKKDGKVDHCMSKQCFLLMENNVFLHFPLRTGFWKLNLQIQSNSRVPGSLGTSIRWASKQYIYMYIYIYICRWLATYMIIHAMIVVGVMFDPD